MLELLTKIHLVDEKVLQKTDGILHLSGKTHSAALSANTLSIITTPISGDTSDSAIVWDSTTKRLKRVSQSSIASQVLAGGLDTEIQYNRATALSGDSKYIFNSTNKAITLGTRLGAVGGYSFVQGCDNTASGLQSTAFGYKTQSTNVSSHAQGSCTLASGVYSHAEGFCASATSSGSHSEGSGTYSCGVNAHAEGCCTRAICSGSHAEGYCTTSSGIGSHSGGFGQGTCKIFAFGKGSFNHSYNTTAQNATHGALAPRSAILGGSDHNIEVGNTGATIVGGSGVKLTGTSYVDTTAVDSLAIYSIPTSGSSSDDLLTRNTVTGVIETRTTQSIGSEHNLGDHIDTTLTGVTDGSMMYYDTGSTKWLDTNTGFTWNQNTGGNLTIFTDAVGTNDVGLSLKTNSGVEYFSIRNSNSNVVPAPLLKGVGAFILLHGAFGNSAVQFRISGAAGARWTFNEKSNYEVLTITQGGLFTLGDTNIAGNRTINALNSTSNANLILQTESSTALTIDSGQTIIVASGLTLSATPTSGTSDQILIRNEVTGVIEYRQVSTLGEDNNIYSHTSISTGVTLTANEYVVLVQTSGNTVTVTLPSSPVSGQTYKIKDKGNALINNVTISGNGNNIDGNSNATINTDYGALELMYDGTEWFSLSFMN